MTVYKYFTKLCLGQALGGNSGVRAFLPVFIAALAHAIDPDTVPLSARADVRPAPMAMSAISAARMVDDSFMSVSPGESCERMSRTGVTKRSIESA